MLLQKAAQDRNWNILQLDNWRVPPDIDTVQDISSYGEPLFVAAIAQALSLSLIEPTFDWLPNLPTSYTKRTIELTTLSEAKKRSRPMFVKPADDKCFPAVVSQSGEQIQASSLLSGATPVLISEVVQWQYEYRFFVMNRKICTTSIYLRNGELTDSEDISPEGESEEITAMVEEFLADPGISVPPAVVIDAGMIANRGLAILEANPAFGSGLYRCNPDAALDVVARSLVKQQAVTAEDLSYIIKRQPL